SRGWLYACAAANHAMVEDRQDARKSENC
ncbi:hypothetical protein A2U01_0063888, partial [Trifolium medium]|nr:hypothetical protein [Trifolium medium]